MTDELETIDPQEAALFPMQVRKAEFKDAPQIHELSRAGYEAHAGHFPDAEYPYVLHFIIEQINLGFVWVVVEEESEAIIGVSMVSPANWPWNTQVKHLQNDHLYVDEDYRNTGAADMLMSAMTAFAAEHKVPLIVLFTYGTDIEVVKGYMAKHNGQLLGANFLISPPSKQ